MRTASGTCLTLLARVITILLIALIIVTASASLIIFNVEQAAFNPATYKRALISENFYQHFPALLGDLLEKNIGAKAPPFIQRMTAAQWQVLLQDLLPPQQLQTMTEDALNQMLGYLNGVTPAPRISLVLLKQSLGSPAGLNAALTIITSQPDCTITQIANIIASFGGDLCNPPQEILGVLRPVIQVQLQVAAATIPDEMSMIPAASSDAAQMDIRRLRLARLIMHLSPLIPIACLLCVTVLAVRTFKGWLALWGWPLLLAGLLGSLIGFGGAPVFRLTAERILSRRLPLVIPPEVAAALQSVVDAALREMLRSAAWESLALFAIGLVMILIWVNLARKENKKIAE